MALVGSDAGTGGIEGDPGFVADGTVHVEDGLREIRMVRDGEHRR